jgi:AcrR family transcriptional regulator
MTPRAYRMTSRAETTERTRASIVRAARELHTERGLSATSWEDIAQRAGVSTATAYRHFPSLAELVPACARTVFDIIQPPTLEQAAGTFDALHRADQRFEQLVRYSCHCYLAGSGWLHAAHRERDFFPELDEALRVIEDSLDTLVTAAAGHPLDGSDHRLLVVLCDFPLWWSLVDRGTAPDEAEAVLVRLVLAEVDRIGLDGQRPDRADPEPPADRPTETRPAPERRTP